MNSGVQSHTAPAPSLLSANAGFVGSDVDDGVAYDDDDDDDDDP